MSELDEAFAALAGFFRERYGWKAPRVGMQLGNAALAFWERQGFAQLASGEQSRGRAVVMERSL